jgi:hypothetical protein
MNEIGTSQPSPAAPKRLPPWTMLTGTGSPWRDDGKSSGTDAESSPPGSTPECPVSLLRAA